MGASQLTEQQKNCLRHVARNMSSKEIALALGLAPATVDKYLKEAMRQLGVNNRRDAARSLLSWELSQKLGDPPQALVVPVSPAKTSSQAGWAWVRKLLLPIPVGGSLHDLGPVQKALLAVRAGFAGVVLLLAILALFLGFLTVFSTRG